MVTKQKHCTNLTRSRIILISSATDASALIMLTIPMSLRNSFHPRVGINTCVSSCATPINITIGLVARIATRNSSKHQILQGKRVVSAGLFFSKESRIHRFIPCVAATSTTVPRNVRELRKAVQDGLAVLRCHGTQGSSSDHGHLMNGISRETVGFKSGTSPSRYLRTSATSTSRGGSATRTTALACELDAHKSNTSS